MAAFLAAYALVFNVMLTTALVASISPVEFNARHELCLNAVSTAQTGETKTGETSDPGKTIVSCPICLSGTGTTIDAPPASPALAIRIALHVPFEAPAPDAIVAHIVHRDHQPRGPPHLS